MILAEKIIQLRKKNGWSQEELAEQMKVSRQSVSKWESAQSIPDLNKLLLLSQLFGVSTDFLLRDELELEEASPVPSEPASTLRQVSLEEARRFLALKEETAPRIALGVSLCVLSPVPLLGLGAAAEAGRLHLSEDQAGALGCILLLLLVAAAVAIFLRCGSLTRAFEFLEREPIETEYGVTGLAREWQARLRPRYDRGILLGVCLCILSVIPLFLFLLFTLEDFFAVLGVMLLLALVSVGVYQLVTVSVPWEATQMLLQEEDYTPVNKRASRWTGAVSGIYWLGVVAIYLAISLPQNRWNTTWVLWPVAGVLFALVMILCNLIKQQIYREDR